MADKKKYVAIKRPKKLQDAPIENHINVGEALRLRFSEHWTFQQIADKYGVTRAGVEKRLRSYTQMIKDSELVDGYDKNRQTLFNEAELRFITEILTNNKKTKDANLSSLINAMKTIYEMNRLEKGKSTQNVAVSLEERLNILEGK